MVADERKRQKQLAKKKSKQLQKQRTNAIEKQQLLCTTAAMRSAADGKILHCLLADSRHQETNGMVAVTLARSAPGGRVAFTNFLVDLWCLGVKDCSGKLMSPAECRKALKDFGEQMSMRQVSPESALAIVAQGIRYAQSLGLKPHGDYSKLSPIWSGIPEGELPEGLEFGRDGRPCYIVGPYDDQARQYFVLQSLFGSVGEGNFDFVSTSQQQAEQRMFARYRLNRVDNQFDGGELDELPLLENHI